MGGGLFSKKGRVKDINVAILGGGLFAKKGRVKKTNMYILM